MGLTLKQIANRLKSFAESHKQINTVYVGDLQDFLTTSKDVVYPACVISINRESSVDITNREHQYNFSVQLYDLQMLADKSGENELELQSDLSQIASDLIALINLNEYLQEWVVPENYTLRVSNFQLQDVCVGVVFELPVSSIFTGDVCAVPSDDVNFPSDNDMKLISNYTHTIVSDTDTLTLPLIKKEILILFLGNLPMQQVASNPSVGQFTYDYLTGDFVFGVTAYAGTFIQILNRNI